MLVSITIPVYNDSEGLKKSLESLILQSYEEWEAIVVDDGSNKSLLETVTHFKDSRIIFYRLKKNQGRPIARQKTFELMNGFYCGFLDAGDCYEKNFIRDAIELFKKESLIGVSQSMKVIYRSILYESTYTNSVIDIKSEDFNKISFASTIFISSFCKKYQFDSKLKYSQDRHFLNSLASNYQGKIGLIDSKSYIYCQGDNMKLKTTFLKYYYDSIRLLKEKKYIKSIIGFNKTIFISIIHLTLGYEKLLEMRFKKK